MTIDRFEGEYAVCECADKTVNIPRSELPAGAREGSVLRLVLDAGAGDCARRRMADKQNSLFD